MPPISKPHLLFARVKRSPPCSTAISSFQSGSSEPESGSENNAAVGALESRLGGTMTSPCHDLATAVEKEGSAVVPVALDEVASALVLEYGTCRVDCETEPSEKAPRLRNLSTRTSMSIPIRRRFWTMPFREEGADTIADRFRLRCDFMRASFLDLECLRHIDVSQSRLHDDYVITTPHHCPP